MVGQEIIYDPSYSHDTRGTLQAPCSRVIAHSVVLLNCFFLYLYSFDNIGTYINTHTPSETTHSDSRAHHKHGALVLSPRLSAALLLWGFAPVCVCVNCAHAALCCERCARACGKRDSLDLDMTSSSKGDCGSVGTVWPVRRCRPAHIHNARL